MTNTGVDDASWLSRGLSLCRIKEECILCFGISKHLQSQYLVKGPTYKPRGPDRSATNASTQIHKYTSKSCLFVTDSSRSYIRTVSLHKARVVSLTSPTASVRQPSTQQHSNSSQTKLPQNVRNPNIRRPIPKPGVPQTSPVRGARYDWSFITLFSYKPHRPIIPAPLYYTLKDRASHSTSAIENNSTPTVALYYILPKSECKRKQQHLRMKPFGERMDRFYMLTPVENTNSSLTTLCFHMRERNACPSKYRKKMHRVPAYATTPSEFDLRQVALCAWSVQA